MMSIRSGILGLLLSVACLPSTQGQTRSVREILGIIFDSTNGYYWNDSEGWDTNEPYCSWSGIQCYDVLESDERYGHIYALNLGDNGLQGNLPQEVWSIPFLSSLTLRENPDLFVSFDETRKAQYLTQLVLSNTYIESFDNFVGENLKELHLTGCSLNMQFPDELLQLKNLKALYANYNNFYGYIPSRISDMESLVELYLFKNNFEGYIPKSISLIEDLEILALSGNRLTGEVPGPQLNNLQNLRILALANNYFEGGIPSLDGISTLTQVYLEDNDFTGEVPEDFLWNAPKNEEITVDLSNNHLSGVFRARRLTAFYKMNLGLSGNEFTGIDEELCAMDEWMDGKVREYQCDAILCPVGSWAPEGRSTGDYECEEDCETAEFMGSTSCDGDNMRILSDFYNALNGDQWKENNWFDSNDECEWTGITCYTDELGNKYITKVQLSGMKLSGKVPSSLFALEGLEVLDLSSNKITFSFDGIRNAKTLDLLDISGTGLDSLENIGQLSETPITELFMSNNNINGGIPDSIYDLTDLTVLKIAHNKLNGNISQRIGQLTQLKKLSLYGNRLTGELPEDFIFMSDNLEELILSENDFTGEIPDAFSNMPYLRILSIHQMTNTKGGLTGAVPDFVGSVSLTLLSLASNSLSSYLPNTFMEESEYYDKVVNVDLSRNNIRGSIPDSLDAFGFLNINLSDNLIDEIPDTLCTMKGWQNGVVGVMGGCNPILCPKGSFNAFGRATPGNDCVPCPGSEYYGATTCQSLGADEIWWALSTFYASTNGDDWGRGDGWLQSPNPCDGTWDGITCDNENIDILGIDLEDGGLTGTPDPIIFTLPRLEVLNLASNDIDFTFEGVENAKNLRTLYLSETRVSSLLGVGKGKSLTELHLTSSYLTGQIPEEIYDLTNLKGLFMNDNQLTGRLSPKIGQMQNLEELFLIKNSLTGQIPVTIGNLRRMKELALSENYLVGNIPDSINNMKDLEVLGIQGQGFDTTSINGRKLKIEPRRSQAYAGLTGSLPSLTGLTKIKELYLGFNSLSGKIPFDFLASVEDKTKQITIDLESNNLSGTVPSSLTQFDNLDLWIGANKFSGIASGLCSMNNWFDGDVATYKCDAILCPENTFSDLGRRDESNECKPCPEGESTLYLGSSNCVSKKELDMEIEKEILKLLYDKLDGIGWHAQDNWNDDSVSFCEWHGITCVSGNNSVKAIHLGENGLKGVLPSSVFELPNLMELNLARNEITINFDSIGSASNLAYLNVDATGLKDLNGINSAESLTLLHASFNDFTQFPQDLLTMKNMKVLYLSNNKFDGSIPDLSGFNQLAFFACKKCGFSGHIPSWFGNMPSLQYLSLSGNKLTGAIPSGFNQMNSLTHLDLSDQAPRGGGITGSLPSFSSLQNISEIYLHKNKLSGSIPNDFLAKTTSDTVTVDLRWNSIGGSIPQTLKGRDFVEFVLLLAENKIDDIPSTICDQSLDGWNQGDLAEFGGCDGLLCNKGYYSQIGRATEGYTCIPCEATDDSDTQNYYGSTTCGSSTEMNALEKIFNALGGPDWADHYGWLDNDFYCTWYGVDCDGEKIIGLDLSSNNLVGNVPREVFDLVDMTYLSLKDNAISVNFNGVGKLSSLVYLNLSETGLTSVNGIGAATSLVELHLTSNELTSIPDDLYNLSKLESLLMNYNKVEGSLSSKIGQLSAIKEIYMFRNMLSGNLPKEIGSLSNLEVLSLGENNFSGKIPEGINDLQNLRVIALQHSSNNGAELGKPVAGFSGRGLSGSVPSFDNNPFLREVYLSSNSFTGNIPNSFLRNVDDKNAEIVVDLAGNAITGVPSTLTQFSYLNIYLAGNQISELDDSFCEEGGWMNRGVETNGCDAILCPVGYYSEFGRQTNEADYCQVCPYTFTAPYLGSTSCAPDSTDYNEREILKKLYEATGGSKWYIADNWLEDTVHICDWHGIFCENDPSSPGEKKITEIHLPSNKMEGTIPPQIFNLQSLRMLNVRDNKVDVELFAMRESPVIEELYLDYTHVSSLKGIGRATNLQTLHVQENNFSGEPLPDELFDLTNLRHIFASGSNIGGELSPKIRNLKELKELYAHGNHFTGEIPEAIGDLEKLEVLVLSENFFVGPLPTSITKLYRLESLFVDSLTRKSAGLSGPLPSFDGMPYLRQIYLNENSFTGTIPENFLGDEVVLQYDELDQDGLSALDRKRQKVNIGLRGNRIEGSIPGFLSKFEKLNIDLSDNFITKIDYELCEMENWMGKDVGWFECDAILCPAGTYNEYGRQTNARAPCKECEGAEDSEFLGATKCMAEIKKREREVLEIFFNECGGNKWKHNDNWMDEKIDICNWYGIQCSNGGTVESIALGANNIVGIPPKEIFELENLKYFWLYSNPVKFSFSGIGQAKRLQSLLLDSTGLESLEGIGQAYNLVDLDLRFNNLKGPIPSEISNLVNLETLTMSDNDLTGELPSFTRMHRLRSLRLSGNDLTGPLPTFASNHVLNYIDLSENRISGTISPSFLDSMDFEENIYVDLSRNRITGKVPRELSRFEDLTIYLKDNYLFGIERELCDNGSWNDGDVGEYGCDAILCAPGSFAAGKGRHAVGGSECQECKEAKYFGQSQCIDLEEYYSSAMTMGIGMVTVLLMSIVTLVLL